MWHRERLGRIDRELEVEHQTLGRSLDFLYDEIELLQESIKKVLDFVEMHRIEHRGSRVWLCDTDCQLEMFTFLPELVIKFLGMLQPICDGPLDAPYMVTVAFLSSHCLLPFVEKTRFEPFKT